MMSFRPRFSKTTGSALVGAALALVATTLAFGTSARADMKALEEAARKEGPMTWYISFYGQEPADAAAKAFMEKYP